MQPDRGVLLGDAGYWPTLSYAYGQQGALKQALAAAREGDKRAPGASATRIEAAVLAMLGDTAGANEALGRISTRYAWGVPRFAASSAALLANRDKPDAMAMSRQFAEGWLKGGAANEFLAFQSDVSVSLRLPSDGHRCLHWPIHCARCRVWTRCLSVLVCESMPRAGSHTRDSDSARRRSRSTVRLQRLEILSGRKASDVLMHWTPSRACDSARASA